MDEAKRGARSDDARSPQLVAELLRIPTAKTSASEKALLAKSSIAFRCRILNNNIDVNSELSLIYD